MKTARIALLIACVALLMAALVSPAFAASTATVDATVKTQQISCTVSTSTVDFGFMPMGVEKPSGVVSVTNDGNGPEDIWVRTTAANNGTGGVWTPLETGTPGTDQFNIRWGSFLGLTDAAVLTGLASGATSTSTPLELTTPTSTTQTGTYSFTITFTATASP
jgi:hypothetical protein